MLLYNISKASFLYRNSFNPLSAECLVYLKWKFDIFIVLDPRRIPRSLATHASLCNNLPSDNFSPKLVIFRYLEGLKKVIFAQKRKSIKFITLDAIQENIYFDFFLEVKYLGEKNKTIYKNCDF